MNGFSPNYFLLLKIFGCCCCCFVLFFFASLLSAPSYSFSLLHVNKRDNHYFEKKARENKFENKSENTLYTGQFSFDRRSTN